MRARVCVRACKRLKEVEENAIISSLKYFDGRFERKRKIIHKITTRELLWWSEFPLLVIFSPDVKTPLAHLSADKINFVATFDG